jgi:hypothetical protein
VRTRRLRIRERVFPAVCGSTFAGLTVRRGAAPAFLRTQLRGCFSDCGVALQVVTSQHILTNVAIPTPSGHRALQSPRDIFANVATPQLRAGRTTPSTFSRTPTGSGRAWLRIHGWRLSRPKGRQRIAGGVSHRNTCHFPDKPRQGRSSHPLILSRSRRKTKHHPYVRAPKITPAQTTRGWFR